MKEVITLFLEKTYQSDSEISSAEQNIINEPSWLWIKTALDKLEMSPKKVLLGSVNKTIWPELPRLDTVKLVEWLDKQSEEHVFVAALDNPMIAQGEIAQCVKFHRKNKMDVTLLVTDNKLSTGTGFYRKEILMKLLSNLDMEITMHRIYKELQDFVSAGISRYWVPPENLLSTNNSLNRSILTKSVAACTIKEHLYNEVNIPSDSGVIIGPCVKIGKGTIIYSGTILVGNTVIGENCEIGSHTRLEDTVIGDNTLVRSSHIEDSVVGNHTKIGPMSHIRPGCVIGDRVKIGNFVEIKNTKLGDDTSVSHLTYVGDSDVGKGCNFGCGSVTVNYDGINKHRTTIEDNVFIGCNTNLVAPVTMGEGSFSAAGTTITEDVPADALAISRPKQTNIENWAKKHREKNK